MLEEEKRHNTRSACVAAELALRLQCLPVGMCSIPSPMHIMEHIHLLLGFVLIAQREFTMTASV